MFYAELFTQKAREKMLNIDFQVEVTSLQNKVSQLNHELNTEKNKVTQTQFQLNESQQKVTLLEENVDTLLTQKQGLEVELEAQRLKASRKKDKEQLSFSIVKKAN
jgi:chromosome segregation ATPase